MPEAHDSESEDTRKPLTFREVLLIVLSGHIGVRKRRQREEDFRRANGLHVFLAAMFYFLLVVFGLIVLVNNISS
jgi:hypothetical protein